MHARRVTAARYPLTLSSLVAASRRGEERTGSRRRVQCAGAGPHGTNACLRMTDRGFHCHAVAVHHAPPPARRGLDVYARSRVRSACATGAPHAV